MAAPQVSLEKELQEFRSYGVAGGNASGWGRGYLGEIVSSERYTTIEKITKNSLFKFCSS
jgi:hypothetical protein